MQNAHRKTVRHVGEPGHIHELTFSFYRRMPLLTNDLWLTQFAESLKRALKKNDFELFAFVFMPEHVHLLVRARVSEKSVSDLLRGIKRSFSYRVKQLLLEAQSPLLKRLTIRKRPGQQTFRFWQEGPGYDRNVTNVQTLSKLIDYIHENPVKRRLCQKATDWKWSSARQFLEPSHPLPGEVPKVDPLPYEWRLRE